MKKLLQILPNGTHAREINEYGKEPEEFTVRYNFWQQAESSLKEYRIEIPDNAKLYGGFPSIEYAIGSTHEFECNEETLTAILI